MPKVKRNSNLSRVARRRVASSDNLPSSAARKTAEAENTVSVQAKDHNSILSSTVRDNPPSDEGEKINEKRNATDKNRDVVTDAPRTQQLSRGQRKRQAKREQFLKKEKMILSSLMLQRQEEQKKRIDGLDAIRQALMDATANNINDQNPNDLRIKPVQHITTNKAKHKLVAKEIEHVNLILQHPSFKKNPLETMQEHLRNTLAKDKKNHEILSKKRTEEERRKTESKRAAKDGIKKKSQKKKYKPRRTR